MQTVNEILATHWELDNRAMAVELTARGHLTNNAQPFTPDIVRNRRNRLKARLDFGASEKGVNTNHFVDLVAGFEDGPLKAIEQTESTQGDTKTLTAKFNRPLTSEKEAIEFFEVDLTRWEPVKQEINSWCSPNNGELLMLPQVKLSFRLRKEAASLNVMDLWLEANKDKLPVYQPVARREKNGTPYLLMLSVSDLHLNKLAWEQETGDNYDTQIAISRFKAACDDLVSKASSFSNVGRICLVVGNDLFNVDGNSNTTTGGTPQSVDSRHAKVFREALDMYVDAVLMLSQVAPVDVVVVPGNHDRETSFYLGACLEMAFLNNLDVQVDNSPLLRKYYSFGKNLFLLTHGSEEKLADLPLIMATGEPELWGNSLHREVLIGHFHKRKVTSRVDVDDQRGVITRIMPSLCGTDQWHFSKGYGSRKGALGLLYHPTRGAEVIFDHFPEN